MKKNIIHIGLDVDDTQYHGSALNQITGEILDFKCRPNLKGLLGQLDKLHQYFPGSTFKLCYEASYIGYTLQRDLVEKGYPRSNTCFMASSLNSSVNLAFVIGLSHML